MLNIITQIKWIEQRQLYKHNCNYWLIIYFCHKNSASNLLANVPIVSGRTCGVCIGVGGDDAGVLNRGTVIIFSKKPSSCFSDNALWSVSNGRIGGTPPKPSKTWRFIESKSNVWMSITSVESDIIRNIFRKHNLLDNRLHIVKVFRSFRFFKLIKLHIFELYRSHLEKKSHKLTLVCLLCYFGLQFKFYFARQCIAMIVLDLVISRKFYF